MFNSYYLQQTLNKSFIIIVLEVNIETSQTVNMIDILRKLCYEDLSFCRTIFAGIYGCFCVCTMPPFFAYV